MQFGLTSIYHFLFIPLPLGLSGFVAYMQTHYYQPRDDTFYRMTKFWGKLPLINIAIGVVMGIVNEFQFGMNWSKYSCFVGDIFGAPLAVMSLLSLIILPLVIAYEGWSYYVFRNRVKTDKEHLV